MTIEELIALGSGRFVVEPEGDGSYYVNFLFKDREGDTRRETLFDGLTRAQADDIKKRMQSAQKGVYYALLKYRNFIYE